MLAIAKRTDYGLMALCYLAEQHEDAAITSRAIAERFAIPAELLAKTLQLMARNGIVESRNGPKGGYVLSRRPESISVAEVIQAIEGPIAMATCQIGDATGCEQYEKCTIFYPMERIQKKVTDVLEGMTLLDMVGTPAGEIR